MSNENAGNPDVLNFPRDTTVLRIAMASEERNRILREHYGLDPLSQMDGTPGKYKKLMKKFFDDRKGGPFTLTGISNDWYTITRADWHGWTDFLYTGASAGTKGGDNANKTCVASTNTVAGQDDYAGNPLFVPVDCIWEKDPDTLEPVITEIEGITDGFNRYDPTKFVGVLQQSAWVYQTEGAESWRFGYSSEFVDGTAAEPLPEARKAGGGVRPWIVHNKYPGKVVNGKWVSYSGIIPTSYSISHNALHTIGAATGTGISGTCYCDIDFLRKMAMIKYGSLTLDGILQGCVANNYNGTAQVSETGVKRILLTSTAAAHFEVGIGVLIGTYTDRGHAAAYSISGNAGCLITAIEDVTVSETDYKAIYVDVTTAFDTTAETTIISTFFWPAGTCDKVLGNDGSPANPGSGVYPAKLQGIEFGHGGLIALADTIQSYTQEDGTYYHQLYFVNKTADQTNTLTANYKPSGVKLVQPGSDGQNYIKHMKLKNGVFVPSEYGGSSSTYFKDSNYLKHDTIGLYEYLAVGNLSYSSANGGVSYADLHDGLANASWYVLGGPAPNGDRGGEWAA